METKPYFKVWAAESLLSDDLDELTDHEHRVWFFLMCAASLENPRWTVKISPQLIKKCKSSAQKFTKTIERLEVLGMISVQNGVIALENASRWNEETEKNRGRKPSDAPERVRERVQKYRDSQNVTPDVTRYAPDVTPDVTPGNASHKEEEEEKEEEREGRNGVTPPADAGSKPVPLMPKKTTVTAEWLNEIRPVWAPQLQDFDDTVAFVINSSYYAKKPDKRAYVLGQLKRQADIQAQQPPRAPGNGFLPHAVGSVPPPQWAMDSPQNAANRGKRLEVNP